MILSVGSAGLRCPERPVIDLFETSEFKTASSTDWTTAVKNGSIQFQGTKLIEFSFTSSLGESGKVLSRAPWFCVEKARNISPLK
jgi:hypothetical protein